MNKYLLLFLLAFLGCSDKKQPTIALEATDKLVISDDLKNFYEAFDEIRRTTSVKEQKKYLQTLFLDKATSGQQSMIAARNYKASEYLDNIKKYPKFFESLRNTMLSSDTLAKSIDASLLKLKEIYPEMKPAKVFFTVGAFRSNGTTLKDRVLIGCELAMVNEQTDLSEFPEDYWARNYWKSNPLENLLKLNVHEFVHTQQVENLQAPLFSVALREGVAEFISDLAMGISKDENIEPSIRYGRENEDAVMTAFTKDMFNKDFGFWLWSNAENKFNTRDLAYFVGYILAERYYQQNDDKSLAIKQLIELDYTNDKKVEDFINAIHYFPKPLAEYRI